MRKLMWFTIGLAGACVFFAYLAQGFELLLLAAVCLLGILLMLLLRGKAKIVQVILAGILAGACWCWLYSSFYLNPAKQWDGQTVETVITVTDYSYKTDSGTVTDGRLTLEEREYRVRAYMSGWRSLKPGDSVAGHFYLRFTAQGDGENQTYHSGAGIFLLAYCEGAPAVQEAAQVPWKYFAAVLRQSILEMLDSVFPEDTLGFARALLLGDTTKLSYRQDTDFKVSGIRHVVAVSGLHVSILFSVVYILTGKRRVLTTLLGVPVLLLFAAVAGFTPSINRACIMQALMLLALLLDKEYDPPTALAFSAFVMLLVNPLSITSVSLQLSVGCMVGIFLFSDRLRAYLLHEKRLGSGKGKSIRARLTRWLAGSTSITLSATVFTTPLSALYFGSVSVIGLLTNLLTLWVISTVFYGIMAACILGFLWLPLGKAIGWIISWPMRYVLKAANLLSTVPFASVYTCSSYVLIWLLGCYVLFFGLLLSKKRRPVLACGCAVFTLCLALLAAWGEPRLDNYRMTVLDVGQGQCILLQCGGENVLVDCGGEDDRAAADAAAQCLLSQGITQLDALILTHYDLDHAGGAPLLLSRIPAGQLYLPDITADNQIRQVLENTYGDKILWIRQQFQLTLGQAICTLYPGDETQNANESSMCILFQAENCDILITSDRDGTGERQLLKEAELPELEVLVVGHHGSKYATSLELLQATRPDYGVISVGEANQYGHPTQETLDRLRLYGCQVQRTDLQGTIIFRG